jgi:hypothetical protein
MNGKKELRGRDRPRVPPPEEEDPRVSGGLGVSATRGLHKSHSLGGVIGDCVLNQFFLLMSSFPAWKLLTGRQKHTETLRGNFPFYGRSSFRNIIPIAYLWSIITFSGCKPPSYILPNKDIGKTILSFKNLEVNRPNTTGSCLNTLRK